MFVRRPESSASESGGLQQRLTRAMLDFVASQLDTAGGSCLLQVWMPTQKEDGSVVLTSQGLPFSVCGAGDLLALFRVMSTGYHFSTDVHQPEKMGAIGRVYNSMEPEMSGDVQKYSHQVFLRVQEAQRCQIRSLCAMPVFDAKDPGNTLCVFEFAQSSPDTHFPRIMAALMKSLKRVHLGTIDVEMRALNSSLQQLPFYRNSSDSNSSRLSIDCRSQAEPLKIRVECQEDMEDGAESTSTTTTRSVALSDLEAPWSSRAHSFAALSPFAGPSEIVGSIPPSPCRAGFTRIPLTSPYPSTNISDFEEEVARGEFEHRIALGAMTVDTRAHAHASQADSSTRWASLHQHTAPLLHENPSPSPLASASQLQLAAATNSVSPPHTKSHSPASKAQAQALRMMAWLNPSKKKQQRGSA